MAKEKEILNYRDMGFNPFGLNPIETMDQLSANQSADYFELAEYSVSNKKVKDVSADKLTAGTMTAVTELGDESIVLDGENAEITIYDNLGNPSIFMKGGSA